MSKATRFSKMNNISNRLVTPLATSPRWHRLVDPFVVIITYTGRRSGRSFSTPVMYRKRGDQITIRVAMAHQKNWWRNFEGEGGPISLNLRGANRAGHAIATRDSRVRATVRVDLIETQPGADSPAIGPWSQSE